MKDTELAPRRITDLIPDDKIGIGEGKRAGDMLGIELLLDDYELKDGELGTFAVIKCRVAATLSPVVVICGAKPVMAQLNALTPIDLPLAVRFEKFGERSFVMR